MKVLLFFAALWLPLCAYSQTNAVPPLERKVTINVSGKPASEFLTSIAAQTGVVFSYNPDIVSNTPIHLNVTNKPVRQTLNLAFKGTIKYKVKGKYIILQKINRQDESEKKEKIVEGYIFDSESGKEVDNATVYNKDKLVSVNTDEYGYFRVEMPKGDTVTQLKISKVGYSDTLIVNVQDTFPGHTVELKIVPLRQRVGELIDSLTQNFKIPNWLLPRKLQISSINMSDSIFSKLNFCLVPGVSTNKLFGGNTVSDVSFNLTVGYIQDVRLVEFGSFFNIDRLGGPLFQYAGYGNIVGGEVRGVQMSGFFNYARSARWGQITGFMNIVANGTKYQIVGLFEPG